MAISSLVVKTSSRLIRHRRADDAEDVGSDLLPGVGELVEGVVHAGGLAEDHVLGRHDDCDEDVVLGLGLDGDVEGLDAGGERARHVLAEARNHPVATRIGELLELASLLNNLDGALGDACPANARHFVGLSDGESLR